MKLIGKHDWLLIVLTGFLISITLLPFNNGSSYNAFVYISSEMTLKIDLTKDGTYSIMEHVVVEVKDKKIRIKESDCPQQLCVKMGWVSTPGVPIVCIPNKIMVVIETDLNNLDYDVITQ
jgi:hypothetical protein